MLYAIINENPSCHYTSPTSLGHIELNTKGDSFGGCDRPRSLSGDFLDVAFKLEEVIGRRYRPVYLGCIGHGSFDGFLHRHIFVEELVQI